MGAASSWAGRWIGLCSAIAIAVLVTGCEDINRALDPQAEGRKPVAPPGIVAPGTVGSAEPTTGAPPPTAAAPPSAAPVSPDPAAAPADTTPIGTRTGVIGKTTARVVDAAEALKDPNVVEVENKVEGSDPLTFATSAYVSLRSKPQLLAFQASLRLIKEGEGRTPTYDEFQQLMKQHRYEFVELYPYQMYGYDAKRGMIVVLEDKAEKAARYKEAGLDPDP